MPTTERTNKRCGRSGYRGESGRRACAAGGPGRRRATTNSPVTRPVLTALVVVLIAGAAACGGSDGAGPELPALSGDYTLTVAVDTVMCYTWPEAVRVRSYQATLSEAADGSGDFMVALGGADFVTHEVLGELSSFSGSIVGDSIGLTVQRGGRAIIERVDTVNFLAVGGTAGATIAGPTISGRLEGAWAFGADLNSAFGHVSCVSTGHHFTLAPR